MASRLFTVLETTLALSEQFRLAVSSPTTTESASSQTSSASPTPPLLLSASAQALKSHTTKLSLLAINTPFTPSAIATVLSEINDSVLPSLVTGALLSSPEKYTHVFHNEARALVKDAIRELDALTTLVKRIAVNYRDNKGYKFNDAEKHDVTTATGRLWKICDQIVGFASDGVVGLVIKKAKEYLELVKDGIRELKEWDPEDNLDDDDLLWDDHDGRSPEAGDHIEPRDEKREPAQKSSQDMNNDEDEDEDEENQRSKLEDEKQYLVRLFTLVSQLYSAIISYRLKKMDEKTLLPKLVSELDSLSCCLQELPNLVDEAAGSLYEDNIDFADAYSLKLRDKALEVVDILREISEKEPNLATADGPDKFSKWVSVWAKVVEDLGKEKEQ